MIRNPSCIASNQSQICAILIHPHIRPGVHGGFLAAQRLRRLPAPSGPSTLALGSAQTHAAPTLGAARRGASGRESGPGPEQAALLDLIRLHLEFRVPGRGNLSARPAARRTEVCARIPEPVSASCRKGLRPATEVIRVAAAVRGTIPVGAVGAAADPGPHSRVRVGWVGVAGRSPGSQVLSGLGRAPPMGRRGRLERRCRLDGACRWLAGHDCGHDCPLCPCRERVIQLSSPSAHSCQSWVSSSAAIASTTRVVGGRARGSMTLKPLG